MRLLIIVLVTAGFLVGPTAAQQADGTAQWQTAIQNAGQVLAKAYESGDAAALADLFALEGEFIDADRMVYSGHDAIAEEFQAFFEASPVRKMSATVDSVRQVAPGVVVEDGRVTVDRGENRPMFLSRYTATYALVEGHWKIASLRDLSGEFASAGDRLYPLQWLIGEWVDESAEGVAERSFYWSEDGNYILGEYSHHADGQLKLSGTFRIGWDPQHQQIKSWIFDSEGGHILGRWSPLDEGWIVNLTGVGADGATGSATNFIVPHDENRIVWKSTNRVVDGESTPDVEVTLVRKPPQPNKATTRADDAQP
jgi:uncharacterized protein (TIGR02246 family)